MSDFEIENIRIEPAIGDGISFTVDIHGVAHRFFVSRATLGELEGALLADNHGMLASFERQHSKTLSAVANTVKLGTSHSITFMKTPFFS